MEKIYNSIKTKNTIKFKSLGMFSNQNQLVVVEYSRVLQRLRDLSETPQKEEGRSDPAMFC